MTRSRKFSPALALAALLLLTGGTAAAADDGRSTTGLVKWVRQGTASDYGSDYGYDPDQPVHYTSSSSERVMIPDAYETPQSEFRAAWVPTVNQISVAKPQDERDFQRQYAGILDRFDALKFNAMIFQVRPAGDAWYPSSLNPWSQYLAPAQGRDPGYDPLAWMIEQTHARGMEYHAWFNPFRVTATPITAGSVLAALDLTENEARGLTAAQAVARYAEKGLLSADNYAVAHPERVLLFNGMLLLDPGLPEVREHVVASVLEVAERYDVDGVHLDDYFYPYRTATTFGDAGEDRAAFEAHGLAAGYADTADGIAQWRRDNVTALVRDIHEGIDTVNAERGTRIEFGVSPFGIWEHRSVDPRGSDTPASSSSTYSKAVFADTYRWVRDELVDYIVPQLYWSFDQAAAPYGELARWWDGVVAGTDVRLYIGHANYKHVQNGPSDPSWTNPDEIPNQVLFNQALPNVSGDVFYGYNDLISSGTAGLDGAALAAARAKNGFIERVFGEFYADRVPTPAQAERASPTPTPSPNPTPGPSPTVRPTATPSAPGGANAAGTGLATAAGSAEAGRSAGQGAGALASTGAPEPGLGGALAALGLAAGAALLLASLRRGPAQRAAR